MPSRASDFDRSAYVPSTAVPDFVLHPAICQQTQSGQHWLCRGLFNTGQRRTVRFACHWSTRTSDSTILVNNQRKV